MFCKSEPPDGSVMPTQARTSPETMPGRQRRFCASVP